MRMRWVFAPAVAAALALTASSCGDEKPSSPVTTAGISGWVVSVYDDEAGGSWSFSSVRLDHDAPGASVSVGGHGCEFYEDEPGFGSYSFWNDAVPGGFEAGAEVALSVSDGSSSATASAVIPGRFSFTKIVRDAGKLRLDWSPAENAHFYVVFFFWPGQVDPEKYGFLTDAPYLYMDYPDDWPADELTIWVYAVNGPKPNMTAVDSPQGDGWPFGLGWIFAPDGPQPRVAEPGNVSGGSGGYWLAGQVIGIAFASGGSPGRPRSGWHPLGRTEFITAGMARRVS